LYDHVEVYMDESGDLGYSRGSSRYLVVIAIASDDPNALARVARRVSRRHFYGHRKAIEFKFNRSSEHAKKLFLRGIAETDARIAWGGIVKSNTPMKLREDKEGLYCNLCGRVMSNLMRRVPTRSVTIVLDKWSSNRTVRRGLEHCLAQSVLASHCGYLPTRLKIRQVDSRSCEGIQVADFVAGAVFQDLERSSKEYVELIAENIIYGEVYW
jgi:hypothetical protein